MSFNHMPSNWEVKKMPSVVKWSSGGTPKATEKQYYENGSIPWLVIGDLNDGIVTKSESKITKLGLENSSAKMIPKGTLLVAMYGSIGKLGITGIECCTNQAIAYAKELYGVTTEYLYYYMAMMKPKLISKGKGGTQKNISQSVLNSLDVIVPPLSEQKRIVARIEELFSELDNGVETLKKTKQQLAVYRQAVLKAAFEGRLTRTYRETKGFEKWEMVPITAVIAKNKNALKADPFGSALKKDCYVPSGYKVYGQEQVIAGDETIGNYYINKKKYEELSSCAVAPEDVLISLVGTVGKVLVLSDACLPGIINPRLIKVTLDATKMLPLFFKYYFESAYLKSLYKEKAHGATMYVLNMGMIKELPFPFCNVKEQRQVIAEIESRLSVCDSIEKTVDAALQQAESMRQSILKKAFEGEL
jgi:type I restriction enzyme S subunit